MTARLRLGVLALVDVAALALLRPHASVVHRLAALPSWLADAGPDVVAAEVAGAAVWLAALWLAVGMVANLGSALPGALGRTARTIARAALPRTVSTVIAGATGVGVLITCTGAQAATHRVPSRPGLAAPSWPTDAPVHTPRWPTTAPREPEPKPVEHGAHDRVPAASVVVARGDSLWRIAAQHLPGAPSDRRIAASWPRWYAANRKVVGPDPNHITPGEVLHAPTNAATDESRS